MKFFQRFLDWLLSTTGFPFSVGRRTKPPNLKDDIHQSPLSIASPPTDPFIRIQPYGIYDNDVSPFLSLTLLKFTTHSNVNKHIIKPCYSCWFNGGISEGDMFGLSIVIIHNKPYRKPLSISIFRQLSPIRTGEWVTNWLSERFRSGMIVVETVDTVRFTIVRQCSACLD